MKRSLLAAFTACGLAMTACTSEPSTSQDSAGGTDDSTTLTIGMPFAPAADWSVFSDDAWTLQRLGVTEPLVGFDESGVPVPDLAADFTVDGPSQVTFELRPDVTFHDGSPVTAPVVAESFTKVAAAEPAPDAIAGLNLTFEAVDDTHLVVTSTEPDPILVQRFGNPEMGVLKPSAFDANPSTPRANDAATGPFTISEIDGTSSLTVVAYEDYWGGKPALSAVKATFLPKADARVAAVQSGEQDAVYAIPVTSLQSLSQNAQTLQWELPRTNSISLNTKTGVFTDPGMRIAALQAIDPQVMVDSVYQGEADVATGYFRDTLSWTKDAPAPEYPEAADPAGAEIVLATYSDRVELPELATLAADELRKAGFTVTIAPVKEYSQMEADLLDGAYDMVIGSRSYLAKATDPVAVLNADFACDGGYNLAQFCDEAVDAAIAEALAESDPAERRAKAAAVETTLLGQGVLIPLVHERARLAHSEKLSGLVPDPLEWNLITHETALS